jgi:hypothetical protein
MTALSLCRALTFVGTGLLAGSANADDLADLFAYESGSQMTIEERRMLGSAAYCFAKDVRQRALQEIRELRRYSKIGGVLNLGAVERQQQAIRAADYQTRFVAQMFQRDRQRMLPCGTAQIRLILECRRYINDDDARPTACTEDVTDQASALTTLTDAIQNGRR